MLNTYFKDRLVCIILLLYVVVLYYRLSCLHWLCVNLKIQLTFHVICLLNACYKHFPICIVCLVFIGCSVLSTIMSTLTSCNSYYPGDISCNLFTECLYQNCPVFVDCLALNCGSVLSTILFTHTSCNILLSSWHSL